MTIKLIPVIEIGYNNQDAPMPKKCPYWEYPDILKKINETERLNITDVDNLLIWGDE